MVKHTLTRNIFRVWVRVKRFVPGYYNNKRIFTRGTYLECGSELRGLFQAIIIASIPRYKRDIFRVWVRVEKIVLGYYNSKHTFTRGTYLECGSESRGLFQAIILTSIPLQEGHIWSVGQSLEDCSRLL